MYVYTVYTVVPLNKKRENTEERKKERKLGSYLPYTCEQISRIYQTMSNSAGKDCQSAYLGSCVDLSTIVVCSDEFLIDRE